MAHFYGTVKGARGEASRLGHKATGMVTVAASYSGAVHTWIWHDEKTGRDRYQVVLLDWPTRASRKVLAEGFLDERKVAEEAA